MKPAGITWLITFESCTRPWGYTCGWL